MLPRHSSPVPPRLLLRCASPLLSYNHCRLLHSARHISLSRATILPTRILYSPATYCVRISPSAALLHRHSPRCRVSIHHESAAHLHSLRGTRLRVLSLCTALRVSTQGRINSSLIEYYVVNVRLLRICCTHAAPLLMRAAATSAAHCALRCCTLRRELRRLSQYCQTERETSCLKSMADAGAYGAKSRASTLSK